MSMRPEMCLCMGAVGALLLIAGSPALRATEYYVSQSHAKAADANPGTREEPLKTISAAAKRVKPGDTVTVASGLYREAVTLTVSGAEGAPIVFRSEEPRKAVVSGAEVLAEPKSEGLGVYSYPIAKPGNCAYLGGNPQWVYLDGLPMERADTRDRLVPGTFHQDIDGQRVYVSLPEGREITDAALEYACREGLFSSDTPLDDIHIKGFALHYTANWFRGKGPIRISGRRWLVEDNHVKWTSYGGVQVTNSNGCVVRGNLIEWAGCEGIGGGYNVDLLLENNTVRYHNWRSFMWGNEGGGSKFTCTIDARYCGNEFAFNYGPGLWSDACATGTLYEKNICHDNTVRSLFSEINWDEVMQDNIVYNTGEAGINISNGPGMVIRRNIVFNNGIGIGLGGNYTRPNDHGQKWYLTAKARMAAVPGISHHKATQWESGFLKYFVAPKAHLNNNCVIWDNILFDNCRAMMEGRDYRTASPMDAFINNFSDYNIYWAASEKTLFNHSYTYQYDDLAAWRKASNRDEHSVVADPRAPSTKLPEWAQACRKDWDLKMRSITEVDGIRDDGVRQELHRSPMAQVAIGRMLRSPYLEAVKFEDPRVRGALFEVEGEKTLALWTTSPAERRYVRLRLEQPQVTIENGYLEKKARALPGGCVDVLATYNPLYIRGIAGKFVESPSGIIQVKAFNIADRPIPASVVFVNEGKEVASLTAAFTPTAGFAVEPASVEKHVAPGEKCVIALSLTPDGSFRRGTGMVRMDASLGPEKIRRTVVFSVGEGDNKLPRVAGDITIDGKLDDWGTLVKDAVPLATVNDASQYLAGPKDGWKGPDDAGARFYAAWKDEGLYLAVLVRDDKVIPCSGSKNEWGTVQFDKCDAVEISLDGRAPDMQWQKELNQGAYDATISPAADGAHILRPNGHASNAIQGVSAATTLSESGYIVEMMIPLTAKNFPARQWEAGRPIKLSLLLFDSDDPSPDAKRKVLGWSVSPEQKNAEDTSGWATVIVEK